MVRLSSVFALICIGVSAFSQGINYRHQYNPKASFQLEHKVVYNTYTTDIFLKIVSADSITNYEGILDFRSSYISNRTDSSANLYLENAKYDSISNAWLMDLSFEKVKKKRLLLLEFIHKKTGMSYYFDVPLFGHPKINQSSTLLYDSNLQSPIFKNYLSTNSYYKTDQSEYIHYYHSSYSASTPPMSVAQKPANSSLSMDTTFLVRANEKFSLRKEGMYFFENDTSNLHGSVFTVRNEHFPKYASIEELISPIRYITTNTEHERLKATPNRETFENVWLEITKDPEVAKKTINNYFKRVTLANMFFTSFKEGWKTDRGMVYIVFGLPSEVHKFGSKEEWIYAGKKQQLKLKFTFVKINNVFSEKFYRLERKKEYSTPWMNKVALWRSGSI